MGFIHSVIQTLARSGAWLLAAIIVALSCVPAGLRPDVGPHDLEHAIIFVALGACIGLGYPGRRGGAVAGVAFCAAVEFVQLWVPGRHARFADLVVDIIGTLVGLGVVRLAARAASDAKRWRARRDADARRP